MKDNIFEKVLGLAQSARAKPLTVAVMGQTGVGKSSLINALFGTDLKTDSVRPCTKEVERVQVSSGRGHEVIFCDLPGLGEGDIADAAYVHEYVEQIRQSDLLVWGIHADSRSVTFERQCMGRIASHLSPEEARNLSARIVVVLTKADVLTCPPWIYAVDGPVGHFVPPEELEALFYRKSAYFYEELFRGAGNTEMRLYVGPHSPITDAKLVSDGDHIRCLGQLSEDEFRELRRRLPKHLGVLDTVRDTLMPVVCSARFRFNLSQVLLSAASRLPREASLRFREALNLDGMNSVHVNLARCMGNFTVYDVGNNSELGGLETLLDEPEGNHGR